MGVGGGLRGFHVVLVCMSTLGMCLVALYRGWVGPGSRRQAPV
eukprot:SAG31_NODE_44521_length_262_cov_0.950920_1_plen_42_part_01